MVDPARSEARLPLLAGRERERDEVGSRISQAADERAAMALEVAAGAVPRQQRRSPLPLVIPSCHRVHRLDVGHGSHLVWNGAAIYRRSRSCQRESRHTLAFFFEHFVVSVVYPSSNTTDRSGSPTRAPCGQPSPPRRATRRTRSSPDLWSEDSHGSVDPDLREPAAPAAYPRPRRVHARRSPFSSSTTTKTAAAAPAMPSQVGPASGTASKSSSKGGVNV